MNLDNPSFRTEREDAAIKRALAAESSLSEMREKLEVVTRERDRYRAALKFYANEDNMRTLTGLPFGRRAREALQSTEAKDG
jgi:hypothetical protein